MNEKLQIIFMQTRLIRLAAEEWDISIQRANELFAKYDILNYVEDCFEIFHMEGDIAVFDDIQTFLKNRGIDIRAEVA